MPTYQYERKVLLGKKPIGSDTAEFYGVPISNCEHLHGIMYAEGFRQVYSTQRPVIQLSFYEAMEESDELLKLADRGEGPLVGADVKGLKDEIWAEPLTKRDLEESC